MKHKCEIRFEIVNIFMFMFLAKFSCALSRVRKHGSPSHISQQVTNSIYTTRGGGEVAPGSVYLINLLNIFYPIFYIFYRNSLIFVRSKHFPHFFLTFCFISILAMPFYFLLPPPHFLGPFSLFFTFPA